MAVRTDDLCADEHTDESASDFARFVLAYPAPAMVLGSGGVCTHVNEAALALLSRSRAEIVGQSMLGWLDRRAQLAASDWIFELLTGTAVRRTVDVRTGSGALLSVKLSGASAGGEIGLFLSPEASRGPTLLERAVESLKGAVLLLDRDHAITYANAATEEVYGVQADVMVGEDIWSLVDVSDKNDFTQFQKALRVVEDRGRWSGRIQGRRASGETFWAELTMSELARDGGQLAGYSVCVRDLTEEMLREQQASRAAKLAQVGTLLSNTAHELNNPIASIANFIHLMLSDETRSETDRHRLELMQRETERLGRVVADLRTMVRKDEDTRVERGPVDLNGIVRHILEARAFRLNALSISVQSGLAEIPAVFADRSQIEQVLLNLIVNAEHAMDGQQEERRLRVMTEPSMKGARVVIDDSGPGIPEHLRDRIFDPFYTSKGPGDGVGLGLSLVHHIVAAHAGDVSVTEAPDGGARFIVDLPLARKLPMGKPADAVPAPAGGLGTGSLRILLVDDEEVLRTSIKGILGLDGHEVDEAADGQEAIDRIDAAVRRGCVYDVILSDLRMAGLGGERLLALLREREGDLDKRVIFVTGDTASSGATRLLSGVPVIYKPFKPDEVLTAVRAHAERLKN